jgi:hypothetical protein
MYMARRVKRPKPPLLPTWESHLYAVGKLIGPGASLEHVMERASILAAEVGRRDWACAIWQSSWRSRVIAAAGVAHA